MTYAATTPATVRRAVRIYVAWRRLVGVATALLAGVSAAAAVALVYMVVDRYVPLPQGVRNAGPWIAAGALAGGIAAGAFVLLRRHAPFGIAVRLDQAFPEHRDRWSSSLDLAEQVHAGRKAGDATSLQRLFADTEALPARLAGSIVSRWRLWVALAGFLVALLAVLFVRASPAFDLPLLWERFCHPRQDLPRDSATRIVLLEVNGQPFEGTMPDALPEGSPLGLRVELRRKPGIFSFGRHEQVIDSADQIPPRLERATAAGVRSAEFTRAGAAWIFTQPRLDESLEFRLRADDGLTQTLRVGVTPRIKLAVISAAIRFPRYARMKDQPFAPLQTGRISALADSFIDFQAAFDRPLKSVTATYETIKSEKDPDSAQPGSAAPQEAKAAQRKLHVQTRDGVDARFTMRVEDSGILRLSAVGANGLVSEQWVCAIEAVPDAPPRIVVTGLDPETTIVPGETVAFHFRAEDDLAVAEVAMDWSSAGGIHSSNLGGAESLGDIRPGQKVVEGEQLIQRMEYPFYGTEPLQFFLTATDSKGQESHTEIFRIHAVSDDYATRFDRGMKLLEDAGGLQNHFLQLTTGMAQQLKIITTASGGAMKWDAKLDTQFENLLHFVRIYGDWRLFSTRLTLRYGGVPQRLDRSLQLLLAVPDLLPSQGDLAELVSSLKTTDDLPGAIGSLRSVIDGQVPLLNAWEKAIKAEEARFQPERLLNQARGISQRLAALEQLHQSPDVAAANLKFYLTQVDAWLGAAALPANSDPDLAPLAEALASARKADNAHAIVAALHPIIEKLSTRDLAPSEALAALAETMTHPPGAQSTALERFQTTVARIITTAGQDDLLRPAEILALANVWLMEPAAHAPDKRKTPASATAPATAPSTAPATAPSATQATAPATAEASAPGPIQAPVPGKDQVPAAATVEVSRWYPAPADQGDAIVMSHQVWESLRMYRADLIARRFEMNPQEGADAQVVLRERALSAREVLLQIPTSAPGAAARDKLAAVLERLARPGAAATDEKLSADLTAALRAIGTNPIANLAKTAQPMMDRLIAAMRKTAGEYDHHADAVTTEAARTSVDEKEIQPSRILLLDDAARLQVRTEGLESLYRAVKLALIQARLLQAGPLPQWSYFEPLHAAQLGISLAASQAGESVSRIHIELAAKPENAPEQLAIAARNSKRVAERLRSTAQLLETAMAGRAVSFDYAQLMKDARAEGLLGALRQEYELVQAHAAPADAAALADVQGKLSKSAMARVVRSEQAMGSLESAARQLKLSAAGKPPALAAALRTLESALKNAASPGQDAPTIEALPAALADAAAAPADEPVAKLPALLRRVQSVTEALAGLSEGFHDQARLPVINITAQQNRRFTTRDLPYVWTLQGVIDGFDRRWLATMRDLELSLTRSMLETARPRRPRDSGASESAGATDLKLQYGRMIEWRTRNFANDRRRNQGISLLAPDNGPSLRLPEHIAEEFLRARNLSTPDDFKPRIETYYKDLYHDLAK